MEGTFSMILVVEQVLMEELDCRLVANHQSTKLKMFKQTCWRLLHSKIGFAWSVLIEIQLKIEPAVRKVLMYTDRGILRIVIPLTLT